MSSQGSRSPSSSQGSRASRSPSPRKQSKINKLFVTNLDATNDTRKMQDDLKEMFGKFGEVASCVVKRSHNNQYCFAFIDFKEGQDATQAMRQLNGVTLGKSSMKVETQDSARRRKTDSSGCYKCGKIGHYARQCRSSRDRRRSRSRSHDRKKKKSRRHRSESSESRHHRKKDKKKHKSHKKHKKHKKKHYSSDSDSSD